jgi:hypothetical protein
MNRYVLNFEENMISQWLYLWLLWQYYHHSTATLLLARTQRREVSSIFKL